jgi:deoxyribodipyrimidine photolyase
VVNPPKPNYESTTAKNKQQKPKRASRLSLVPESAAKGSNNYRSNKEGDSKPRTYLIHTLDLFKKEYTKDTAGLYSAIINTINNLIALRTQLEAKKKAYEFLVQENKEFYDQIVILFIRNVQIANHTQKSTKLLDPESLNNKTNPIFVK